MTTTRRSAPKAGARLSKEARRAQLLAVGTELVAASSFEVLSLDDVAVHAGISRSLLFHYFPTRQDFVVAIAEEAARELVEATDISSTDDLTADLRRGLDSFVGHIEQRGGAYVSLVRGTVGGDPGLRDVSERTRRTITDRILASLDETGVPRTSLAEIAVRGWVAMVEEAVVVWLGQRDVPRDDLVVLLERMLVVALVPDGEPDRAAMPGSGRA